MAAVIYTYIALRRKRKALTDNTFKSKVSSSMMKKLEIAILGLGWELKILWEMRGMVPWTRRAGLNAKV